MCWVSGDNPCSSSTDHKVEHWFNSCKSRMVSESFTPPPTEWLSQTCIKKKKWNESEEEPLAGASSSFYGTLTLRWRKIAPIARLRGLTVHEMGFRNWASNPVLFKLWSSPTSCQVLQWTWSTLFSLFFFFKFLFGYLWYRWYFRYFSDCSKRLETSLDAI